MRLRHLILLGPLVIAALVTVGVATGGVPGAPTVTAPDDMVVPATEPAGATVIYPLATATDDVGVTDGPTCTPASGSFFSVAGSPHTVTCTAKDAADQIGSDSFTVTVTPYVDSSPPEVTAPDDMVAPATEPAGATVIYPLATATDNVGVTDGPTCTPASGSFFSVAGSPHTVTCTAKDAADQIGSDSFTVTVTAYVDSIPPVIVVPGGLTVVDATPPTGGEAVTYSVTATDNVGVTQGPTCTPASGSVFTVSGSPHTVTCTASDAVGNTGSSSFSIFVQDADAPVVTAPGSRTVEANGPNGAIVNYPTPTAIDLGVLLPATCTPASGTLFPLGATIVTCSATDNAGHTGSAAFTVTVVDTTPPVLTVPADLAIQSSSAVAVSNSTIQDFLKGATATDIVDSSVEISHNAPATFPLGTTTVVFTAKDDAGNSTEKSAVVTVTTQPVAPPAAADTTPPDNVRRVKAIAGNLSVAIAWRKPRARDFHHVTITRAPGRNGAPETLVYRGKKKTFVARGLKDGVEYRFVIVAYDEAGNRAAGVAVVVFAEQQNLLVPVNGATISAPRRFAWRPVPGADYYNIQFWHDGKKLSVWPAKPRFTLPGSWRFEGKAHKLVPGTWLVYVWAGFGTKAEAKYGELHVDATFVVRRR